jgi:transposase-like protein
MTKIRAKKQEPSEGGSFDYNEFEKEAIDRLKEGAGLVGSDGVLTGLIQRLVNAALSGEMNAHLKEERVLGIKNRRNGHTSKKLDTELGPVEISPPRDRAGRFEPQLVGKWSRQLGTGLDRQILMLYAHGNSYGDIQMQLRELYGLDYSTASITEVTEQVWGEVSAWQQRTLEPFYAAIFLDGIYFTTREEGKSVKKVVYSVYGVDAEGNRDVLGIYIREAEGAKEWGRVLEDLRRRGVEDVLFFCVDGLAGFSEAIVEVFPQAFVQRCIVHMVRSSTRFVSDKHIKAVCADLRAVYAAADEAQAQVGLAAFKQKWDSTYPEIAKAWEQNWGELMLFMEFGENIRRMIYTTNAVEALHRQIRKVTKSKGSWVNDKALLKQIYLILTYGRGGWKKTVFNWTAISRELRERFGQRYTQHLE